jgi:predicted ATPase
MGRTAVTESGVANAETCFAESMKISRRQNAKLFELRAGMSLARLYYNRGKPEDARALLAPLYGQVTEGFDTIDMREAKALLDISS